MKHVVKRIYEDYIVAIPINSYMSVLRENNISMRSNKDRKIILGVLLICIIGIAGGCASDEVNQREMNLVNLESSEIDGQWVGTVDGLDGKPLELTYRFKAEGERLIGLIESRLGGGQISDGKIDGNNIEFRLDAGEDVVILNTGTLSGDEIQLTETIGTEIIKVVLKRVKR